MRGIFRLDVPRDVAPLFSRLLFLACTCVLPVSRIVCGAGAAGAGGAGGGGIGGGGGSGGGNGGGGGGGGGAGRRLPPPPKHIINLAIGYRSTQ